MYSLLKSCYSCLMGNHGIDDVEETRLKFAHLMFQICWWWRHSCLCLFSV